MNHAKRWHTVISKPRICVSLNHNSKRPIQHPSFITNNSKSFIFRNKEIFLQSDQGLGRLLMKQFKILWPQPFCHLSNAFVLVQPSKRSLDHRVTFFDQGHLAILVKRNPNKLKYQFKCLSFPKEIIKRKRKTLTKRS